MVKHNDAQAERLFEHGIRATGAVVVQRPAAELYEVWRQLVTLPQFIEFLKRVEKVTPTRSHWVVEGVGVRPYEWDADIIRDQPGVVIAWKTVGQPEVPSAGTVLFRELPNGRGTAVHVEMEYLPPGRALGDAAARAAGADARTRVHKALHRFRQLMETGEIPTTDGQPVGKGFMGRERPEKKKEPKLRRRDVRGIAGQTPARTGRQASGSDKSAGDEWPDVAGQREQAQGGA